MWKIDYLCHLYVKKKKRKSFKAMQSNRVHILVIEPSLIIGQGVVGALLEIETLGIDISQSEQVSDIERQIAQSEPDIVLINPLYAESLNLGVEKNHSGIKYVALQSSVISGEQLRDFDGVITISDSLQEIEGVLLRLCGKRRAPKSKEQEVLSAREREVVAAIALGKSNKEIADSLFISTHTVMTHRKNIAAKLKIHNPAGLTIYAIVNKLIEIEDIK